MLPSDYFWVTVVPVSAFVITSGRFSVDQLIVRTENKWSFNVRYLHVIKWEEFKTSPVAGLLYVIGFNKTAQSNPSPLSNVIIDGCTGSIPYLMLERKLTLQI